MLEGQSETPEPRPPSTSLGAWLRAVRLERGLSLEAIEAETHVRRRFLEAIEEDRFDDLPGVVYARGFVRLYARALGVDPQLALERLEQQWARLQRPRPARERGSAVRAGGGAGTPWWALPDPLLRALEPARRLRTAGMLGVVVVAVAVAGAWLLSRSSRPAPPPGPPAVATDSGSVAATFPQPPALEPAPPAPPAGEPAKGLVLVARFRDRCWVEVSADGQRIFYGMAQPGEERTWQAQRELVVRLGKAEVVDLELNGQPLGVAGQGVVTRTFRLTQPPGSEGPSSEPPTQPTGGPAGTVQP